MKTLTFDFVNGKIIWTHDDGSGNPVTMELLQADFKEGDQELYDAAEQRYRSFP